MFPTLETGLLIFDAAFLSTISDPRFIVTKLCGSLLNKSLCQLTMRLLTLLNENLNLKVGLGVMKPPKIVPNISPS